MMKKIIAAIFLALPFSGMAQNYNPFVAQGVVSPAPLDNVASNGTGVVSFLVGNTGDDPLQLVTNQEMLLVITLSRGIPNNADPIAAVGGTMASYFDWIYDPGTFSYLGTQNKLIPDALNGGVGTVEILYKVTSNSIESNPQNGFNVNLTPPAYTNGVNSLNDDQVSSYTWTVQASNTIPDMNATMVDSVVIGSVHTNDSVPAGTTYGTPSALSSNPGPSTITMNPNGTYSFSAPAIGVYSFIVPVCASGQTTGCPTELLTITVTDPASTTNAPTANVDQGTTYGTNPITLNTLGNDACNNLNCTLAPGSVAITNPPRNGTATVNPVTGDITYTANPGYYGVDTLTYTVCDQTITPQKCATSFQIINVLPEGTANQIALNDDYKVLSKNAVGSGNVVTNDKDPEANSITVVPSSVVIPGKGTITIASNGAYTFTPVQDFVGTVETPYNACDNGSPQACAKATLYITVNPYFVPLPVQLVSFNSISNGCKSNISWTTSLEENTSYFNILRKDDEHTQYITVGKVMAVGNSHTPQSYSFVDATAVEGWNHYMLEIVDIDGHKSYSSTQVNEINCDEQQIEVYPNPTTDVLNIIVRDINKNDYEFGLYDITGAVIYKSTLVMNETIQKVVIPVKQLAAGHYNLRVQGNSEVQVYKIVKTSN